MALDYCPFLIIFASAFLLDLVIGDPFFLPHPVRIIGIGIEKLESTLRRITTKPTGERTAGIVLAVFIISVTFSLTYLLQRWIFLHFTGPVRFLGYVLLVYLTATTVATKELLKAGTIVITAVQTGNIGEARRHLSMIVGRDVDALDEKGILKAVIETVSENLSDGVIAPIFYLTLGGLPLALAYKAANTLDSMVGYKNDKYRFFGWASARFDDLVNYIPARISGLLIVLSSGITLFSFSRLQTSLKTMLRDGRNHSSPNSGYPEAAIAGALGVQLGGPTRYFGSLVEKPYIGTENGEDYLIAALRAIRIIRMASVLGFLCSAAVLYLRCRF